MARVSNITDLPLSPLGLDLLGQANYTEALSTFIKQAQTPMTIAIQGEWGCGKTSLMNSIAGRVCLNYTQFCRTSDLLENLQSRETKHNPSYLGVWINTWQYSILKNDSEAQISIIRGVARELSAQMDKLIGSVSKVKETGRALLNSIGGLALTAAKIGVGAAGINPIALSGMDEMVKVQENGPEYFRQKLKDSVSEYLQQYNNNHKEKAKGIIFFIDDLDRLDPPVAVQVLSLLKNLFEVPNCIFVLAIDYEVVVQGLAQRFGQRTESNEREFRSFFDKIIQLSFRVPMDNYRIDMLLRRLLEGIQYGVSDLNNSEFMDSLVFLTIATCGKNPRSIKRTINTLSLIYEIHKLKKTDNKKDERWVLLILYALVCMQSNYPRLYDELVRRPNIFDWVESENGRSSEFKVGDLSREVNEELAPANIVISDVLLSDPWIRKRLRSIQGLLLTILKIAVNAKTKSLPMSADASKLRTTKDVLEKFIQASRIASNESIEDETEEFETMDEFIGYWSEQSIDSAILSNAQEFCQRFNQVFGGVISFEFSDSDIFLRANKENGRSRICARVKVSPEGIMVSSGNYRLAITKNGFGRARPNRKVANCAEITEADIEPIKSVFCNYLEIRRVTTRWINTGEKQKDSQLDDSSEDEKPKTPGERDSEGLGIQRKPEREADSPMGDRQHSEENDADS